MVCREAGALVSGSASWWQRMGGDPWVWTLYDASRPVEEQLTRIVLLSWHLENRKEQPFPQAVLGFEVGS